MELTDSFHVYMFVLTLTAMTLQIYLFFVVIFVSPPSMRQYRYFLCMFVFWDFFYNLTIGVVIMPSICASKSTFIVNGLGRFLVRWFGYDMNRVIFALIFWFGADILKYQVFALGYRFCALHPNPVLLRGFMYWPVLVGFHVFGQLICCSVAVPAYFCVADEDRARLLIAANPESTCPGLDEAWVAADRAVVVVDLAADVVRPTIVVIICWFLVAISVGLSLSLYIIRILKANAACYSQKTFKLHLQLTHILILQQVTPILFVITPLSALGGLILSDSARIMSDTAYKVGVVTLALYPSTNCCIYLYICAPYRAFTRKWISNLLCRLPTVSVLINNNKA